MMSNSLPAEVEAVLDARVRPALLVHGGGVDVEGLDHHTMVLRVRLRGTCAGCPAADESMRDIVRGELLGALPDLADVVLVSGVSEELLDQARRLMGRNRGPVEEESWTGAVTTVPA